MSRRVAVYNSTHRDTTSHPEAGPVRTIKRYSNRKLYDTEEKRYITLDQIATLVRDGLDIKVIDNQSGEDLTTVTLSQILVEQEKKKSGALPKSFLTKLIQRSSSSIVDYVRRTVSTWAPGGAETLSEEQIDERVDRLVSDGELSAEDSHKVREDLKTRAADYKRKFDEFVERRVHDVLGTLNIASKADIETLVSRLEQLQTRLNHIRPISSDGSDAAASSSRDASKT